MFLISALRIMLQLYEEHRSVLKKSGDRELCPAWCFVWLGWLIFVYVFSSFHASTQLSPLLHPHE